MFRIYQNTHDAMRFHEHKDSVARRHTAPVSTDPSNRRRIFPSSRIRCGIFRAASHNHTISSRIKPKQKNHGNILLQASSADEKTLWLSTLSPLVEKFLQRK